MTKLIVNNGLIKGTIDPTKEEEDRFSPIIDLDPFTYGVLPFSRFMVNNAILPANQHLISNSAFNAGLL